jgi:hypothetical protein
MRNGNPLIEAGIKKIVSPGGRLAYVCGRSIAWIAGSSPVESMDIRLFRFLCCVGGISSFRSVLPCARVRACVYIFVCVSNWVCSRNLQNEVA